MKVLLVSTYERRGGAAVAASRLLHALRKAGADASMLVMYKDSCSEQVHQVTGVKLARFLSFAIERFVIWTYNLFDRKNLFKISFANTGFDITSSRLFADADIVNLHWVNHGFLSLDGMDRILHSGKKVVWTMHDMWECTAICHHAFDCTNFKNRCAECHYLVRPSSHDMSARIFDRKKKMFASAQLHVVAVSSWLKQKVEESALLGGKPVTVISNTLDSGDFVVKDKQASRHVEGLPADKLLVLFGAARIDDSIKGFDLFLEAVRILSTAAGLSGRLHVVLFGYVKHKEVLEKIPVPFTMKGVVNDTSRLNNLYSAADVFVSASSYETFGQTIMEAQACGCLTVSFGNSGQKDIVDHLKNGYLADYMSPQSLAEGMKWALSGRNDFPDRYMLRENVLKKFGTPAIAARYMDLYKEILKK